MVRLPIYLFVTLSLHIPFAVSFAESSPPKVGVILALSGAFASTGEDSRRGVEAARAHPGNSTILMPIYADSKNEPSIAISEFRKLMATEKIFAVYIQRSALAMPLIPISKAAKVPLLGAVGHQKFASENEYAIQVWPRASEEGEFLAKKIKGRNLKTVSMIYTDDEWTSSVSDAFREEFVRIGGTLLLDESVSPAETDFRSLITQIRLKPAQAYYLNVLLQQTSPLLAQMRNLKVEGELYFNFYASKKEVLDASGAKALEGVRYVELSNDMPRLAEQLGLPAGEPVPGLTVSSYVASMLIAQTLKGDARIRSAVDLYAALQRQQEVETPDYVYPVVDRRVQFPLVLKRIEGGKPRVE